MTKTSNTPVYQSNLLSPNLQYRKSLPPLLLTLVTISILLLVIVGGALFFFPQFSQPRWLWPLAPFNTRFLGAIYLTALVSLVSLVLAKRAALTRLIIPMMWVFTTVVLTVSCLQLQQFTVGRRATDIWFWLYLVDCIGASYYLGYYRQQSQLQPFAGPRPLPRPWSIGLGLQAGLLGAYGLGLLLMPKTLGSEWPWPLDLFHAQLYSSIFLTGAVGAAILSYRATAIALRALGAIQVTFSSLVLIGIWIVDRAINKIDWSGWGNWVWVGAIALLGLAGLALIQQSFTHTSTALPPDNTSE